MKDEPGHLVAVGSSWGGLEILQNLLRALPGGLDAAVVIAQHRSPDSHPTAFRDLLRVGAELHVCEADDKDVLEAGTAYVAAPDYHLLVQDGLLSLSTDEPVQFARPSIDVLLETAAESFRERCVGIVLTGANDDGARGLARVVELGGTAIVQDPTTATRAEMPRAALRAVPDAHVVTPEELPRVVVRLCGVRAAA